MSIVAEKLNFIYNPKSTFKKQALFDINLEIKDGEFVAIVGHTGSGKTTFVQHLNALIRVQSGKLVVNDIDLSAKKIDFNKLRGQVGMVFQYPEYQLFADTVEVDVAFGPKNIGIDKEEIPKLVKDAVELVGLDFEAIKNKSPFDLSGGEKRRVALAGVLAMNPKVLVLDEPTAGLDPQGKREILSIVKKFNKEKNITVIMVSHDMNEVYENADRIVIFNQGKIVADSTPVEIFKNEELILSNNLEVPYMAQFCNMLRANNINLEGELKTVDSVASQIEKLLEVENV